MTPQEIITDLDAHGFTDTDALVKLRIINSSIRSIASLKAWPFLHVVQTINFSGSSPVPTNTPADLRAVLKIIDTTTGRRVRYKAVDEMEENYGNSLTLSGDPFFYYFEGTQLRVWKVPGAAQTLRLRYVKVPALVAQADPESAIAIPPIGHEAILFRSIMRLADLEDDTEIASRFGQLFEMEMQKLTEAFAIQQFDQPEHVLVMDDDDFNYDM